MIPALKISATSFAAAKMTMMTTIAYADVCAAKDANASADAKKRKQKEKETSAAS